MARYYDPTVNDHTRRYELELLNNQERDRYNRRAGVLDDYGQSLLQGPQDETIGSSSTREGRMAALQDYLRQEMEKREQRFVPSERFAELGNSPNERGNYLFNAAVSRKYKDPRIQRARKIARDRGLKWGNINDQTRNALLGLVRGRTRSLQGQYGGPIAKRFADVRGDIGSSNKTIDEYSGKLGSYASNYGADNQGKLKDAYSSYFATRKASKPKVQPSTRVSLGGGIGNRSLTDRVKGSVY